MLFPTMDLAQLKSGSDYMILLYSFEDFSSDTSQMLMGFLKFQPFLCLQGRGSFGFVLMFCKLFGW